MANLIPPDAKKAIVTEYWFRVVILWCVMISVGLIFVMVLQIPTLMLIKSDMNSFSEVIDEARAMSQSFEESEQIITEANTVATLLASEVSPVALTEVVDTLDMIAGPGITIQSLQLNKVDGVLHTVAVRGMANTRESLADFSTDLEADPLFAEADLPFSNLAKDRDIAFNISIVPATQ